MTYLNVSLSSLRGRRHPALSNMLTTIDVQKSRPHLKMLCKDYFTYEKRADQSGGSPHCRVCSNNQLSALPHTAPAPAENLTHILTKCSTYSHIRDRIFPEFAFLCSESKSGLAFNNICSDKKVLVQFLLDPASFNLHSRLHMNDPLLETFFKTSRDYCYAIHTCRMNLLQKASDNLKKNKIGLP